MVGHRWAKSWGWLAAACMALGGCGEEPSSGNASQAADSAASTDGATTTDGTSASDSAASSDSSADGAATGVDGASGPDTAADTDTASGPDTAADTDTASEPDTAAETDTASDPDTAADTDTASDPDTAADTDTASGPDTAAEVDSGPTCKPTSPPSEVCDGLDNDCDGTTDQAPELCAAASACVVGTCAAVDGKVQCSFAANPSASACDDGDACTEGDSCSAGSCAGKAKACDDGDACSADSCSAGNCLHLALPCDDNNPCTTDACDKQSGCSSTANNAPCSDGDACTEGDSCSAGSCTGKAKPCDDANACTSDSCDKLTGCKNSANTGPCDDGDACTSEVCGGGSCKATAKSCDDKDACTADSCDQGSGSCVHNPIANCKACTSASGCDDANACTSDACNAGKCSNTAIGGCLGPTDFSLSKLTGVPAQTEAKSAYGNATFSATILNTGKKPSSGSIGFAWYLSKQGDLLGDASSKIQVGGTAGTMYGYDVVPNTAKSITVIAPPTLTGLTSVNVASYSHLCLSAYWPGDANPSDNHTCAPTTISVAKSKPLTLVEKTSGKGADAVEWPVDKPYELTLGYDATGPAGVANFAMTFKLWASKDDKLDPADVALKTATGSYPVGSGKSLALTQVTIPSSFTSANAGEAAWLCAQYELGAPAAWNTSPSDDVKCWKTLIYRPIAIKSSAVLLPATTSVANVAKSGVVFGATNTCQLSATNMASWPSGPVAVRCSLEPAAGGAALFTQEFNGASLNALTGGNWIGPTFNPDIASIPGVSASGLYKWCAHANPDGKLKELDQADNKVCQSSVTVYAPDYKVVTATVSPASAKAATKVDVQFYYENHGNHAGHTTYAAGLYYSADDKWDASDVAVKTWGTLTTGVAPQNKFCLLGPCSSFTDKQVTLPATLQPGAGYLLYVVDTGAALKEFDEGNNVKAVPFTVLP